MGEFIYLIDSTPSLIDAGHKALSVLPDVNDHTIEAAIAAIAGVAPDFLQLLICKICRCPVRSGP
jgi:hypothetical protein